MFTNEMQVTNIEYDEHKGRIAIGRLHAGVLERGIEVKVNLPKLIELYFLSKTSQLNVQLFLFK